MPTYICMCRSGALNAARKEAIASAITTAHAEITGAPPCLAQVIFNEIPEGNQFIGGRAIEHDHIFILGHIRAGRSAVDRKALIRRLTADLARSLGFEPFSVWVYIHELPPAAMVEFGHVLPEAGEESDWIESLPQADAARMQQIGKPAK